MRYCFSADLLVHSDRTGPRFGSIHWSPGEGTLIRDAALLDGMVIFLIILHHMSPLLWVPSGATGPYKTQ